MHPHLFPTSFLIFLFMFFILIHAPRSVCANDDRFTICGDKLFGCGNLTDISYPFSGENRPEYCGHPGFNLSCQENVTRLTIQSITYRVLRIDNTTHTLTVARDDFWNTICPINLYNTTLDPNLFSYTSNSVNLTLLYDCPFISGQTQSLQKQFSCTVNGTNSTNYLGTSSIDVSCSNTIIVYVFSDVFSSGTPTSQNIGEALDGGFGLQWEANIDTTCTQCVQSGGRCGYDSNSNSFTCYCADQAYTSVCNGTQRGTGSSSAAGEKLTVRVKLIIGVVSGGISILLMSVIICYTRSKTSSYRSIIFWRKQINDNRNFEAFIRNYGSLSPKQYSYSEVKKMTNAFKDKLGQGGYGCVYRGKLIDNRPVAVKLLDASKGNGEDFINEVASISRTSHVNVVTLLGFCIERSKRALIYEFMSNGSLEKFIYGEGLSKINGHLGWEKLYQISIGIARGLEYLHRGCSQRILHFDIKPHNILLDEDFCPKISDFGLAKLCTQKESIISTLEARGTIGYIAPEVFSRNFGRVSHKSDVYSYGMMTLEIVGGRKNVDNGESHTSQIYFPHWVYKRLELDEELGFQGDMAEEENEMARKMIFVGLWCIQTDPSQRPSMSKVLEMLEGSVEALEIPPRPYLYSPSRSEAESSTT
ncbi:LEAF RUST 10 DISEASE-RESISTANCE LOCUS RECEPTOR-LIKE PROTEIN KINASE-like 2.5 [Cornus florida]|uniref:LEAF RUST 10 DISEASE-RESISTANCE LOCUS RECEPTOR-LIKE PROTEIN KINASE-like 2.5 n=1 Tax=Cornus florida TaxID=4283 RepID=UPI00289D7726|nr:LEAF RUST 10 DISEASE-RESISTANCE LOCUS RECEPTOR-LIKE PROTEIN KINASE-like 2.5 [Cornus florida]